MDGPKVFNSHRPHGWEEAVLRRWGWKKIIHRGGGGGRGKWEMGDGFCGIGTLFTEKGQCFTTALAAGNRETVAAWGIGQVHSSLLPLDCDLNPCCLVEAYGIFASPCCLNPDNPSLPPTPHKHKHTVLRIPMTTDSIPTLVICMNHYWGHTYWLH